MKCCRNDSYCSLKKNTKKKKKFIPPHTLWEEQTGAKTEMTGDKSVCWKLSWLLTFSMLFNVWTLNGFHTLIVWQKQFAVQVSKLSALSLSDVTDLATPVLLLLRPGGSWDLWSLSPSLLLTPSYQQQGYNQTFPLHCSSSHDPLSS